MISYLITAIAAYLLGSVSSSVLLSKTVFHSDVRKAGSGNAGATNMARNYGMKAGVLVLALDALKSTLSLLIGTHLCGEIGIAIAGILCVLGHCFPIYFHFKGGKGVSVGAIIAYAIDWRIGLCLTVLFFAVFAWKRIVSLCSITVAIALPVLCVLFGMSVPRIVLGLFCGIFVTWQHRSNISRLIRGEEAQFKPKKISDA